MGPVNTSAAPPALLNRLVQLACQRGADAAAVVPAAEIHVDDQLANLCIDPRCEMLGLAASCPPHVGGPQAFRQLRAQVDWAIVLKIDVPTQTLLGEERYPIYRLLHSIAAAVERAAIDQGCSNARAFAGGSCKRIFCADHDDCPVVASGAPCRHPDQARHSMSGYGVDVSRLMNSAGWQLNRITCDTSPEAVPMGSLVGLVLIG
jgi:predicted metal-binding protein